MYVVTFLLIEDDFATISATINIYILYLNTDFVGSTNTINLSNFIDHLHLATFVMGKCIVNIRVAHLHFYSCEWLWR